MGRAGGKDSPGGHPGTPFHRVGCPYGRPAVFAEPRGFCSPTRLETHRSHASAWERGTAPGLPPSPRCFGGSRRAGPAYGTVIVVPSPLAVIEKVPVLLEV